MASTTAIEKNSSGGLCGLLNVTPKSSTHLEDQPFIRSFQVKNDELDDEDALLDLSYARPYDFAPGEPVSYGNGYNIASPLGKTKPRSMLRNDLYGVISPVSPTVDAAFDEPNDTALPTPPSAYGDRVTITTLTLSGTDTAGRGNSGLVATNSSRNVGPRKNRGTSRGAQTAGTDSAKWMSNDVNCEARTSKERGSGDNSPTDSADTPNNPGRTTRGARSRQRRSFFRAVANNDDASPLSPLRGAPKMKVASVLQRVAATAMSSRLVPRARKAGVIDLTIPFVEGLHLAREVLHNCYQGTVTLDAQTELRMQIVIRSGGKSTLCNVFVSGEERPFGCRLWVRRSVADSVRGGNEDFDKFTLNLRQQLIRLCNSENNSSSRI